MAGWVRLSVAILAMAPVLAVVACGGDEQETKVGDDAIVEKLNLKRSDGGYAIDGDPFCEVSKRLLNDSGEIEQAADGDKLGLVISSSGGNAGVEGVAPFAPDCEEKAKKKLNRLDPRPKPEEG